MKYDFVLHLDRGFEPDVYGDPEYLDFDGTTFSGGEEHIKLRNMIRSDFLDGASVLVTTRLNSSAAIMRLLMANNVLDRQGALISAFIPYFPYARQDREMSAGEEIGIEVMAKLINDMCLSRVYIYDPHSDVTPALVNNRVILNNLDLIEKSLVDIDVDGFDVSKDVALVIPDEGACKRTNRIIEQLEWRGTVVQCLKHRDPGTNIPGEARVLNPDQAKGKVCLVVDDICDGGRTFINLAPKLKDAGALESRLCVSHSIFSHGVDGILERFKKVYTTDSFKWEAGTTELPADVIVYALNLNGTVEDIYADRAPAGSAKGSSALVR